MFVSDSNRRWGIFYDIIFAVGISNSLRIGYLIYPFRYLIGGTSASAIVSTAPRAHWRRMSSFSAIQSRGVLHFNFQSAFLLLSLAGGSNCSALRFCFGAICFCAICRFFPCSNDIMFGSSSGYGSPTAKSLSAEKLGEMSFNYGDYSAVSLEDRSSSFR